jgi:hypothetical protein
VLVAVFLGLTLAVCAPRYETNDDAMMNLIVAGRGFADTPDEHLLYSNVLIGLALKHLYRAAPEVPWYGGYLFAVVAAALVAIGYALLRANPSGKQLLLTVGLLLVFALPCVVRLQFTKTAFLAALGGLLLTANVLRGRGPARQLLAATPLLVLACLVRLDACLLACAVAAPVVAFPLVRAVRGRSPWVRPAVVLAGALAVGLALARYNDWYYRQDPGWRDFYTFNALRAQFTDYLRFDYNEHTRPVLDAVGWSKVDLAMLYSWSFADPERFSTDRLRTLLTAAGPDARVLKWRAWGNLARGLGEDTALLALLAVGGTFLVLMGGGWRARVPPLLCLLAAAAVAVVLFQYFYLPRHVSFPAFGAFLAVAAACSEGGLPGRTPRPRALVCAGAALLACGLLLWRVGAVLDDARRDLGGHRRALRMMADLGPRPDRLFVLWADAFPYEYVVFPLESTSVPRAFKAVMFGVLTRTPITEGRLQEFRITDLYRALYERADVFLVNDADGNRLLGAYLAEHYGVRLGGRVAFAHPALGSCRVYSLTDLARRAPPSGAGG